MLAVLLLAAATVGQHQPRIDDEFANFPARLENVRAIPARRNATYRLFHTIFGESLKNGVNFAGHLTLVVVGCGAGCVNGWLVDRRNGRVIKAPVTGEQFPILRYKTEATSRLLRAEWLTEDGTRPGEECVQQDFLWKTGKFILRNAPHKSACELEDHKP